jgi:hypothetical protein
MAAPLTRKPRRKRRRIFIPKSTILFFLGVFVILNEVGGWQHRPPNPAALAAGLACCGIPIVEGLESTIRRALLNVDPEEPPPPPTPPPGVTK